MNESKAIPQLVKLGFTVYQARVYSSLVSLGVGSVSEIHRNSKVPRTKVYESLDDLVRRGAVEVQPGRPMLYRAVNPNLMVAKLSQEFDESAKQASKILAEEFQERRSIERDVAWTVKGDSAIRRKLAELITSAKQEVLMLETYPPNFILSVSGLLKAVSQRGIGVRAVALLVSSQDTDSLPESELIEYRSLFTARPRRSAVGTSDSSFLGPLSVTLSSPYGLAVLDSREAFVLIPNLTDESASIGLLARIPGVPLILGEMFQQFLTAKTRKVRT